MKRLLWLLAVLLLAVPALAQEVELTQKVTLPGGYIVSVPDGWERIPDDKTEGIFLAGGDFVVYVLTPPQVAEVVSVDEDADAEALMLTVNQALYDWQPNAADVGMMQIGSHLAAHVFYTFEDSDNIGFSYVIDFGDNRFAFVDAYGPEADQDQLEDLMADMLRTFDLASTSTGGGEACFVSADQPKTVQLRVGPGENRSVVAFLPDGQPFQAQGRFVDDDGGVWYRLDKDEVAPKSGANEIWVAQAAIDESGDCAALADASAPPVIPMAANPPPSSGDTGGDTDAGQTGGALPGAGSWTMALDLFTSASCLGGSNVSVKTADFFPQMNYAVSVGMRGSTLYFDGAPLAQTGPGRYAGSVELGGANAQIYMTVNSANAMTGQMIVNFSSGGKACSGTLNFSVSR